MEWDQIADNWAAMARRLRSDRPAGPHHLSGATGSAFAASGASRDTAENLPLTPADPDQIQPQRQ